MLPEQPLIRLLLEDLMLRQNADPSERDRAYEALSILALLLCLVGVLMYASLSSTTVVVAAPPGLDALKAAADRAPAP
jgi:hypothetical protein